METKTLKKKTVIFFFIIAFLIKGYNNAYAQVEDPKPLPHALLLVHGLLSSKKTWNKLIKSLDPKHFVYVANYNISESNNKYNINIQPENKSLHYINNNINPVFTINYNNKVNLSFVEQGRRLHDVVTDIVKQTGRKVILIGHSMGGLAARACIMIDSKNIAGLITAGTPHAGSFLAYSPNLLNYLNTNPFSFYYLINGKNYGFKITTKAIAALAPDSPEMIEMNKQVFPINLPIVDVISRWKPDNLNLKKNLLILIQEESSNYQSIYALTDFFSKDIQLQFSDGVVSVPSQHIKMGVANGNDLHPIILTTNKFHTEITSDTTTMKRAITEMLNITNGFPTNNNVTIGFIIDSSGSMKDTDPYNIRKTSLEKIIDLLNGNENIVVIDFDDKANWINENNYTNLNKELLKDEINIIDSEGGTNIDLALIKMKNILSSINARTNTGVVLISDGKSIYHNETEWFTNNNIPIYTISYKDFGDPFLLNRIADETKGIYVQANNESDVISAFQQFYDVLSGQNKYFSYSDKIDNGSSLTFDFYVDSLTNQMYFSTTWLKGNLKISLKSPGGIIYTPLNSPTLFSKGTNYNIFKIKNPQYGKWNSEILNQSNINEAIPFIVEAGGKSPVTYILKRILKDNGIIKYTIQNINSKVVKDISPVVKVVNPTGDTLDISNSFKDGIINFLPTAGQGNYQIDISFEKLINNGYKIQRNFKTSEFINENIVPFRNEVKFISGIIVKTNIGKDKGCYVGMKCKIYSPDKYDIEVKAIGNVTMVTDDNCTIEISKLTNNEPVMTNDIVELDKIQWINKIKK